MGISFRKRPQRWHACVALGLGVGALAATGLAGPARSAITAANVPPLPLPVERNATLRVLRPAKFVDPD